MSQVDSTIDELSTETFEALVLDRSHETPVLVDFWAPWCGPCRALAPVLERVVAAFPRPLRLTKLNTDEHPALAERYRIRGIPAVKLFVRGEVIAEFTGALPDSGVRQFLERHLPSPADEFVIEAKVALAAQRLDKAAQALTQALQHQADHPAAHLEFARLCLLQGDAAGVQHHVAAMGDRADEADEAANLLEASRFIESCEALGGLEACRLGTQAEKPSIEHFYGLGCGLAAKGDYEGALTAFLEVVQRSRAFRSDAGRKAMLVVFGIIGHKSELADTFKRRLQIYL